MSNIIYYDKIFIDKFEQLKAMTEEGDYRRLYRFLLDDFGFILKVNQYYGQTAGIMILDFEKADEETCRELMRPLSHRQYRMIERAFKSYDESDIIWSFWDFLDDYDRIYDKKVMSAAEVSGCSLILEEIYCFLDRKQ